jgi:hypothetical protein
MTSNIFFPVNAKITLAAYVIRLIFQLVSQQSFRSNAMLFYEQPIRDSICFVKANRSKALSTGRIATLCRIVICTPVNTTWRTASPVQALMECAETTPTFFA